MNIAQPILQASRAVTVEETARRFDALLVRCAEQSHSKGCLMAMVPDAARQPFVDLANAIPAADLAGDGIEAQPHVTVLWGFNAGFDENALAEFLATMPPLVFEVGQVRRFHCGDADCINLAVACPGLIEMHNRIAERFKKSITASEHGFNPHLTLAYVKPGASEGLDGSALLGTKFTVTELTYGSPEGDSVQMPLSKSEDVLKAAALERFGGWLLAHDRKATGDLVAGIASGAGYGDVARAVRGMAADTAARCDQLVTAMLEGRTLPEAVDGLVGGIVTAVGSGGVYAIPGFDEKVDEIVGQMTTKGAGQINKATARLRLKDWLEEQHYKPDAPGSATDLSTDVRLDLILETQARMRRGEKQWDEGMTRVAKAMYPCWEFARVEDRKEPRDWPTVWTENGGQFYPGTGSYPEGRMIARKDSTIWTAISRFGNPYPPFDFNSGMGLKGVARSWCIEHKLVRNDEFRLEQPQEAAA